MISTLISSGSRYPISRPRIKAKVTEIFKPLLMDGIEVSIMVVGDRKIRQLNKQYLQIDEVTDVLSFALEEPRGEDGLLRLGDIVISYPQAQKQAREGNILVDEAINRLVEHGLLHLLGFNHDEFGDFKINDQGAQFKISTAKN